MEFPEACLNIAKRSWELNVPYPVVLGFKHGQLKIIEYDGIGSEKDLVQFVHEFSGDENWDALAIINEVWFDVITFGRPLKLDSPDNNSHAQDGLAVTLITRNRSYVSLARVKTSELGKFSPWRIMAGGRYYGIKLGSKLKKAM